MPNVGPSLKKKGKGKGRKGPSLSKKKDRESKVNIIDIDTYIRLERQGRARRFLDRGYSIRQTGRRKNNSIIATSLLLRKRDSRT